MLQCTLQRVFNRPTDFSNGEPLKGARILTDQEVAPWGSDESVRRADDERETTRTGRLGDGDGNHEVVRGRGDGERWREGDAMVGERDVEDPHVVKGVATVCWGGSVKRGEGDRGEVGSCLQHLAASCIHSLLCLGRVVRAAVDVSTNHDQRRREEESVEGALQVRRPSRVGLRRGAAVYMRVHADE